MEARLILLELIRNFEFTLAEPTLTLSKKGRNRDENFLASNSGTMSPKNGIYLNAIPRKDISL